MDDFEEIIRLMSLDEQVEERLLAESSLHEFLKQAWPYLEGDKEFADGWHLQAISEHLQALTTGQINNLLVNIPPRCCKSTLITVAWPAWIWIQKPSIQFLCSSNGLGVAIRDSVKCRRLITSEWYQARWGDKFKLIGDQNTKIKFENDKFGYRMTASVYSQLRGEGGDILICDDPNNIVDGESDVKREAANRWFSGVWSTRKNNRKKVSQVVVQQRLNENDISGYIMGNDTSNKWVKLILPMEFETSRPAKTIILPSNPKKVWQDPRTKAGELLWPEHIDAEGLKDIKIDLGNPYNIAGQLQQRPAPEEGGIIKKQWFQIWKKEKPPKLLHVIQSWDTALEAGEQNDYSACTTWGLFNDDHGVSHIIHLGLWRGRVEYPELRQLAQRLYKDYRDDGDSDVRPDGNHVPDLVLIEAKVSGHSLIQDLRRAGVPVCKFDPTKRGDKEQRVKLVTHIIQCGRVWVPGRPPDYNNLRSFSNTLVDLAAMFPNGSSRDVVDTMTQMLFRLIESKMLVNPSDDIFQEKSKRDVPYYWGA